MAVAEPIQAQAVEIAADMLRRGIS